MHNSKIRSLQRTMSLVALAMIGAVAAQGCGSDDSSAPDDPEHTFYTLTIVNLLPGGGFESRLEKVSLAQQIREREARERGEVLPSDPGAAQSGMNPNTISKDSSCTSGDLKLFDAINYGGNAICFTGTGNAALSTWCRVWNGFSCTDHWGGGDVKSYIVGNTDVQFGENVYFWCCECTLTKQSSQFDFNTNGDCAGTSTWIQREDDAVCGTC